jgi:competence protein ComEC
MIDFFRKTPFFRLVIPLIAGIIFRLYFPVTVQIFWFVISITVLSLFSLIFINRILKNISYHWIFGILTTFFVFISGYYFTHDSIQNITSQHFPLNKKIILNCTVTDFPVEKAKSCKFSITTQSYWYNDTLVNCDYKLILFIEKDSNSIRIKPGDVLQILCKPQKIKSFPNSQGFDYATYMFRQGILFSAYVKKNFWVKTDSGSLSYIQKLAFTCKSRFLQSLKNIGLQGNNLAVASALTIGYKTDLDQEIKQAYSSSGTMHILAVSGLHVGLLYIVLGYMLQFLDFIKKIKFLKPLILIAIIWFYSLLTGLSPSVLRSALMLSFISFGQISNRQSFVANAIASSAFILLLINPMQITDVGFQLSYIAVIGIVLFYPFLVKLVYFKNIFLSNIWQLTAVSIAAQITTFPLTIYYFHQFPNYFILSNILAIPISTLAMYAALLLVTTSFIPFLFTMSGMLLNVLINLMNTVVLWIEKLPYSQTKGISITEVEIIFLYLLVTCFTLYLIRKKTSFLLFSLIIILMLLWYQIIINNFI